VPVSDAPGKPVASTVGAVLAFVLGGDDGDGSARTVLLGEGVGDELGLGGAP
jgi:hypothetical protein